MNLFLYLMIGANLWIWVVALVAVERLRRQQIILAEALAKLAQATEKIALSLRDLVVAAQREQGKWN
jgi:hypothetical protein